MPPEIKILFTKSLPPKIKNELSGFALRDRDVIRIERIEQREKDLREFLHQKTGQDKFSLVITSKNALHSLENIDSDPFDQIFCVGDKTARLLFEKTGWKADRVAGTARALIPKIPDDIEALVYPCSTQRLDVIPEFCRKRGIVLHEFSVYQPVPIKEKESWEADVVCFYSPSGVRAYYSVHKYRGETTLAIGPTTGKALENFSNNIVVSEEPCHKGMVSEIKKLYSSKEKT